VGGRRGRGGKGKTCAEGTEVLSSFRDSVGKELGKCEELVYHKVFFF